MSQPFQPKSSPTENVRTFFQIVPWKLFILVPILALVAIPTFLYFSPYMSGTFSNITSMFYTVTGDPLPTPIPHPDFAKAVPTTGTVHYEVDSGDNCVDILASQMHMNRAGNIFSDSKPETVHALEKQIGQDCHKLQPGMSLSLPPQYPLGTISGEITNITKSNSPLEALPTPLIRVPEKEDLGVDCVKGCRLTVRMNDKSQVQLIVYTTIPVKTSYWIWSESRLPRQNVQNFSDYPYVDASASLDGTILEACDLYINQVHDDEARSCSGITPNTISADNGSWLLAVTGPAGLDQWGYHFPVPANTRLLLWLAREGSDLKYHQGDAVYRYDENSSLYVKL